MQQRKAVDFAELFRQGVNPVMMPSIQESYVKKMLRDLLTWGFLSKDI